MKRNIFSLLKGNRLQYALLLLGVIVAALLAVVNPFLTRAIVDDVIGAGKKEILVPILVVILSVTVFRLLLRYFCQMQLEKITLKIKLSLWRKGFRKLMELDFSFFDRHASGDIMAQLTTDVNMVGQFFIHVICVSVENIAVVIGALAVLLSVIHTRLSAVMLVVMPVAFLLAFSLARLQKKNYRNLRQVQSSLNTVVSENIWAQRAVKAFVREEYENEKLETVNQAFREGQLRINRTSRKMIPYLNNIHGFIQIYMIFVGGIFTMKGMITLGDLIMFNSMSWLMTTPLSLIGFLTNDAINCLTSYDKVMDLMEEEPQVADKKRVHKLSHIEGKVEFMHVSFRYQNTQALSDVSFVAEKGMRVGIIGQTGSGKSSVISLLSRFYDPDAGAIFLDDHYIRDIDLDVIRSSIATSQQDVFLFSDTVAANIAYGSPGATREEVIAAAKTAMADEFIQKLPDGYETVIGERGIGLSGGQKQRLALARAILKQPAILVLDDTTSALDSETEKEIQEKLKQICKDTTLFIISQKISSVRDCDMILVMRQGALIQKGTHNELLADKGGYYYSVYQHQYGGGVSNG